jgi:hypothetical protein
MTTISTSIKFGSREKLQGYINTLNYLKVGEKIEVTCNLGVIELTKGNRLEDFKNENLNICPFCSSDEIEDCSYTFNPDVVYKDQKCKECKISWSREYKIKAIKNIFNESECKKY